MSTTCYLLDNVSAIPQLLGLETLASPFAAHASAQRLGMLATHIPSSLTLHHSEQPRAFTGFDTKMGQYEFDPTTRDQGITILAIVPKYVPGQGAYPIKENPSTTVIYRGDRDNKVGYFNLDTYTKLADGFGYKNTIMNTSYLTKGNYVPKEVKFITSPAHHGNMYGMGVNLNTLCISLDGVTEDAFVISRSAARKLCSTAVKKATYKVSPDQYPQNAYGDSTEFRFMPDIGEEVRDDGLLCCFRKPTANTFLSDIVDSALLEPQHLHDTSYMVPFQGATVIDIDVNINRHYKNKIPRDAFSQVMKYKDANNIYYQRICETYREVVKEGYQITPAFNTLVFRSMAFLLAEGHRVPGYNRKANLQLVKKKDPIEFLNLDIYYQFDNIVSLGFKITGRDGAKGVICVIEEDENMPVDQYGIRADLLVDGNSVNNRMNPSNQYEMYLSRSDEFIRRRILKLAKENTVPEEIYSKPEFTHIHSGYSGAWEYLISYITDVNKNWAQVLEKTHPTPQLKEALLEEVCKDGLYQFVPPYLAHVDHKWVLRMNDKYPVPESPVTFNIKQKDGTYRPVTTVDDMWIGSKYIYCLNKIPHLQCSSVSYINQHKTPILMNSHARMQNSLGPTPLRAGEDEVRNFIMAIGPKFVARLLGLHANSTEAVNKMIQMLLNEKYPTRIKRVPINTSEIIATNNMAATAQHLLATTGIDITKHVSKEDLHEFEHLVLPTITE